MKLYKMKDTEDIFIKEGTMFIPLLNKQGLINLTPYPFIETNEFYEVVINSLDERTVEYIADVMSVKEKWHNKIHIPMISKDDIEDINKCERFEIIMAENDKGEKAILEVFIDEEREIIYETHPNIYTKEIKRVFKNNKTED